MAAFLPVRAWLEFLELGIEDRQFLPDQLLGALHHLRVFEEPGHVIEGLGHVLHPEVGDPQVRDAVFFLHHLGQVHGGPGALDHVQGGAVGPADVVHPAVAGDVGHHLDAHALEVVPDDPDLPGQVEVPQDVEAFGADAGGVAGAHQSEHGLAGGVVAGPLVALEAFGLHRQHRDALLLAHLLADALQVVADDAHDAGGIDEGGLGVMPVDEFDQGPVELCFAAEDHVHFLEVGGEAQAVEFRPRGQGPPDVPGVGGAADGAVHQVQGIGDGVEHHPGAAEDAGPLAHRPGQAVLVAVHLKGRLALAVDLVLPFFKNGGCS